MFTTNFEYFRWPLYIRYAGYGSGKGLVDILETLGDSVMTDMVTEGEEDDIEKRNINTKDMEEVDLVIDDEIVVEVKDDTFCKAKEDDGDKRSSSNTSGGMQYHNYG